MRNLLNNTLKTSLLAGLILTSGASQAVDVYLQTQTYDKTISTGPTTNQVVPMWGYVLCEENWVNCALATDEQAPQINLTTTDDLTIRLMNTLTTPVSVLIPGQNNGGDPVMAPDGQGRMRVQSLVHEALPSGTADYVWNSLLPGTYLYQSGTHPSIQVPMGLFGALVVTPTTANGSCSGTQASAYDNPNSCFDAENVMLFSEIDSVQNTAVSSAVDVASYPSTIDYNPSFFLTNGGLSTSLVPAVSGDKILVRLLNAGLRSHSPSFVGLDMALIAEDGNLYPGLPRLHSAALLPAGKTLDVILDVPFDSDGVTESNNTFSLFDRMPTFSNEDLAEGLASGSLVVGTGTPPSTPPLEVALSFAVTEDVASTLNIPVATNLVLRGETSNGSIAETGTGPIQYLYTPNANFSGVDNFTYFDEDNQTTYNVTLNVSFVNDVPIASADSYSNALGAEISTPAPGILGNDSDIDGDSLSAQIDGAAPVGLTLNSDGSFTYSGADTTFSYVATDGTASSLPVTVSLSVLPVSNIAISVIDPKDPGTPVLGYRWTVEENVMWQPDPEAPQTTNTLGTNFHKSYMPIVAQGVGAVEFAQLALDPTKHYYVSVLPADAATGSGHTIGGAPIPPGSTEVSVNVNSQPLPYAQISILAFEDNSPTNGAVDGAEINRGLGGFQITLEDAGGKYGISGGTMSQDADGNPLRNSLDCFGNTQPPRGVILTCPNTPENLAAGVAGEALIKNLYPGKYGIITTPAVGSGNWSQTSTIEGSKVIDAWVKAGEPAFFREFGAGSWHVFVGFVNPDRLTLPPGGTNIVTGKVTNAHLSRPPSQIIVDSDSYAALAHTRAWVGLNSAGGNGANVAVVQADADGNFTLSNIPDGIYQLVVWDSFNDQVIAYRGVSLPGGGDVGNMPVFNWFARSEHNVFLDDNQNGVRDAGEVPISEQAINLRWRDGTVNQSFPTDLEGFVPFDQTFPFFHWQVLEVDFARFKATGLTVTVDNGGDVSTGDHIGLLAAQQQGPCTQDDVDNNWNGCSIVGDPYANPDQRTETGPVLTQGFQGFLGQTSIFDWGKAPYAPGENGGISGIVYYGVTRAENDPRLAAAEPWEPGVPSATVRLYREVTTSTGDIALALVQETKTDNWDGSIPTGCPGADPTDIVLTGGDLDKCYDGFRNFNQARPAVFDGGYAFMDIDPGTYVVEVVPPPGYDLMKEEDNNVAFGDVFANLPVAVVLPTGAAATFLIPDPATLDTLSAEPGLAQPRCVGATHEVPLIMSLFPSENAESPFAGAFRPLCDRKEVFLSDQGQSAADFFLFTSAPIAGHFTGAILDDLSQAFDRFSPQFGEKFAPPFIPVSVRDHNGVEISRVYSDQWGRMNGLVPSTFSANAPSPSGFSPAMLITCMNDPGPIIDVRAGSPTFGDSIIDPQYNPAYSNFCYTFQYMPGSTTYLDTPVLPVSAFASGYNPVNCALDEGTPMIQRVDGTGFGPLVSPEGSVVITSRGSNVSVNNPAYEGPVGTGLAGQKTIVRDFGFGGTAGTVTVGGVAININSWGNDVIEATLPAGVTTGQLVVTRGNGNQTEHSITLTVSNETPIRVSAGSSIQDAVDIANPGQLILVEPGSYNELVIMWKPVRLQGAGAGSTIINATKFPVNDIDVWRTTLDCLYGIGAGCADRVDSLPNQLDGAAGFVSDEGAAITVVAVFDDGNGPRPTNSFFRNRARIDGFSITGGDIGGGIFVNGYAHRLEISNNNVFGNNGIFAGGIRIGRPFLRSNAEGPFDFNRAVNIHNNSITQNGGLGGAGGGLSILSGSDRYSVTDNFICGNFTTGDGAGIGHLGLSDRGRIENNRILFNQSFSQASVRSGGGILIAGEPAIVDGLTHGAGDVTVNANIIQGNHAGAGHGGGIRTQFVNGRDIANSENNNGRVRPGRWHTIRITNNMITNNVAGWSGGGISMQDTARSFVINNTVAHNDSTSTVSGTFVNDPNISVSQPAGISSEPHSIGLSTAIPAQNNTNNYRLFSNPRLRNNVIWENRSFFYDGTTDEGAHLEPILAQSTVGECVAGAVYADLGVLGNQFNLQPRFSVLTDATNSHQSNTQADPLLVNPYCNGSRQLEPASGPMLALPAVDEGGSTWIDVRYGPLTHAWPDNATPWDYHLGSGSPAVDAGSSRSAPRTDFDGESRPMGNRFDIGADELVSASAPGGIVSFSSGAFGEINVGQTSMVTITVSVSDSPVVFTSSSELAVPFAKTNDTCSGTTVLVGNICTYTITFNPTNAGIYDSHLFVDSNASNDDSQAISLSGTGVIPPGTVSFSSSTPFPLNNAGTELNFGNLENGNVETTVTLTAANFPVTFSNLGLQGSRRYRISNEDNGDLCSGVTLVAGENCTIIIIFNANGNRFRQADLVADHNGIGSTILSISGR